MPAFVHSIRRGYLGEIPKPSVETDGVRIVVEGHWKGTPPRDLDACDDLVVRFKNDPKRVNFTLVEGRVTGGGRLTKRIEGRRK